MNRLKIDRSSVHEVGSDRLSRAVPAHALPALLGGPALAGHRLPDAPP